MTGGEEEGERTIVDDQDENQVFFMFLSHENKNFMCLLYVNQAVSLLHLFSLD